MNRLRLTLSTAGAVDIPVEGSAIFLIDEVQHLRAEGNHFALASVEMQFVRTSLQWF